MYKQMGGQGLTSGLCSVLGEGKSHTGEMVDSINKEVQTAANLP